MFYRFRDAFPVWLVRHLATFEYVHKKIYLLDRSILVSAISSFPFWNPLHPYHWLSKGKKRPVQYPVTHPKSHTRHT